jgi:hypothetical protein
VIEGQAVRAGRVSARSSWRCTSPRICAPSKARELLPGDHRGKVEQGPAWGSKGDAAVTPHVVGVEAADAVDPQARFASGVAPYHGHIHLTGIMRPESPERRGGLVTQHSAVSTREHGRSFARQRW